MDDFLNTDGLLHVQLLGGQARALLVKSTGLCETARVTHNLSRVATAALGRLLTISAMMGVQLKGKDDSLTCMVKGDGPLGRLMAVARPDGTVKGCVDNPGVDIQRRADGKLAVGDAVGRNGMLSVIKDLGMREPYVGQVHLVSGELGEDFAMYFTASEQTPSLVSLGVLVGEKVEAAGGLIVQMLPGADEAAIRSVEMSAPMLQNISSAIKEYDLRGALAQMLTHLEPEVLGEIKPRYRCDCSRERVERALISLGKQELREMIDDLAKKGPDERVEVDCHFCNRRQKFSAPELEALLVGATRE